MTITRRAVLSGLAAAAGAAFAPPLRAQPAFPAGVGTIKIVIPFAPGGGSDIIGRLLADGLTKRWGVPAVVEHVPGASATVGVARVAQGPADGSQILILNILYVTTQFLMSGLPYEPERDIVPLAYLTQQPNLFCVKKDLPVSSVAEFINFAKERPGKLNYASSGVGSPLHLSAELFQYMTGTRMTHIPYSGSAPSQNALAGGHVDVLFDNAAAIVGLARSGAVKPLAITTPSSLPAGSRVPGNRRDRARLRHRRVVRRRRPCGNAGTHPERDRGGEPRCGPRSGHSRTTRSGSFGNSRFEEGRLREIHRRGTGPLGISYQRAQAQDVMLSWLTRTSNRTG